jgi:hypothetical protein
VVEAVHHFVHLFVRAFACSYAFLGTSPGGLAAQVLTIFTTEVQGGWWRSSAWKVNWQGGLKRAVYTLFVVWAITFAVCTVTTIYKDHQNIAGRWQAVVREKDELKNGLTVRDKYIQQLTEENTRLDEREREQLRQKARSSQELPNNLVEEVRTLTDTDQQLFIQSLRSSAGSRVSIVEVGNIPEPHIVAQQLADSFSVAGWIVRRSAVGSSTQIMVGVGGAKSSVIAMSPRGLCAEALDIGDDPMRVAKEAFANVRRRLPILKSGCPNVCACPGPPGDLREHELRIVVGPR